MTISADNNCLRFLIFAGLAGAGQGDVPSEKGVEEKFHLQTDYRFHFQVFSIIVLPFWIFPEVPYC